MFCGLQQVSLNIFIVHMFLLWRTRYRKLSIIKGNCVLIPTSTHFWLLFPVYLTWNLSVTKTECKNTQKCLGKEVTYSRFGNKWTNIPSKFRTSLPDVSFWLQKHRALFLFFIPLNHKQSFMFLYLIFLLEVWPYFHRS